MALMQHLLVGEPTWSWSPVTARPAGVVATRRCWWSMTRQAQIARNGGCSRSPLRPTQGHTDHHHVPFWGCRRVNSPGHDAAGPPGPHAHRRVLRRAPTALTCTHPCFQRQRELTQNSCDSYSPWQYTPHNQLLQLSSRREWAVSPLSCEA